MIQIENVLLSDDIVEQHFICNIEKCKGACCVEGDSGAPLEAKETLILNEILPLVLPYMSEIGKETVIQKGTFEKDFEGDFVTTTVENRECVFAFYDEQKMLHCAIEKAYLEGEITFQKPISCHLYPIRAQEFGETTILNYERWNICSPACELGTKKGVKVYEFLEKPLIRKFGAEWYENLKMELS